MMRPFFFHTDICLQLYDAAERGVRYIHARGVSSWKEVGGPAIPHEVHVVALWEYFSPQTSCWSVELHGQ